MLNKSDKFANDLLDMIRQATSEEECMALSEKYAVHFAKLQKVNPVRAIHIINLVAQRRAEFQRARERENEDQMDMFR